MKATIIGLGLIGGSLSKDLKARKFLTHVTGVDANEKNAAEALRLGIADEIKSLEKSLDTDLVIIAIPVDALRNLLPTVLDKIGARTVVVDMGSTKESICSKVRSHKNRNRYVAAHPIAGTENAGPAAAIQNLFDNKVSIICEREWSDTDALETVEKLFTVLNMKVIYTNAKDHDIHLAYVSHLSHVIAFALGKTVLDIEKEEENILNLAGSGFASTARLAKSSPSMWEPIMEQNSTNILKALDEYIRNLLHFRKMLDDKNTDELSGFMKEANEIRKVLK